MWLSSWVLANTDAGADVFEYRTLPIKPEQLPAINLTTPYEVKESQGRGAPKFTSVVHLVITGRVAGATDQDAACALEALTEQIELATLANTLVVRSCSQFRAVETNSSFTIEGGRPIGEVVIVLQAEFLPGLRPRRCRTTSPRST